MVQELLSQADVELPLFMPGHSGDMLVGGHVQFELLVRRSRVDYADCVETVLDHHFLLWPDVRQRLGPELTGKLRDRIEAQLRNCAAGSTSRGVCRLTAMTCGMS